VFALLKPHTAAKLERARLADRRNHRCFFEPLTGLAGKYSMAAMGSKTCFHCGSRLLAVFVAAMILLSDVGLAQQDEALREKTERVVDILTALGVRDGAHIADVGSSDGFYTLRIARAVAPTGKAYAIDIEQKSLDKLRERAQKETISNVEIILSEPADPKLPPGALDAVLIRNAYHEMVAYREILNGVLSGLKSGGLLVVSEGMSDSLLDKPREQQVKEHYIAPGIVEAELREAGFEIVERDDAFTRFTGSRVGGYWMIRARRPSGGGPR
jgi:predicted methyltransferase